MLQVRYGMTARNLLRGPFMQTLVDRGANIVVVTPAANEPYLKEELEPHGVTLVESPELKKRLPERIWDYVSDALVFRHPGNTRAVTVKWLHESIIERDLLGFAFRGAVSLLFLHKSHRMRRLLLRLGPRFCSHPEIGSIFETYKPDLFVASFTFEPDVHYLREAMNRGIRTVGIVKSWDNMTSKSRMAVEPDVLIAWSPDMKDQAIRYHSISEDRIKVVGTPQFDVHFNHGGGCTSRSEFLESLGADPAKKLIVYCPEPKWTYSDADNLRLIHEVISAPDFPYPAHIHVRNYPKSERDYSGLERELGVTSERAGTDVPSMADGFDQTMAQAEHMSELMHHADLVIQVSSTIVLDASCHDTPCIGLHLDRNDPRVPWAHQTRRGYDPEHNRMLVNLRALRLATTKTELRDLIELYLTHPETDSDGRAAAVARVIWRTDGTASRRLAESVLEELKYLDETGFLHWTSDIGGKPSYDL